MRIGRYRGLGRVHRPVVLVVRIVHEREELVPDDRPAERCRKVVRFPVGLMFCDASDSASAVLPLAAPARCWRSSSASRNIAARSTGCSSIDSSTVPRIVLVPARVIIEMPRPGAVAERRVEVRGLDAHFLDHVGVRATRRGADRCRCWWRRRSSIRFRPRHRAQRCRSTCD